MLKFTRLFPVLVCCMLLCSCKKDVKIEAQDKKPAVLFTFSAFANGQPLGAARTYTNVAGDSLTVTHFNYYISNIKLKKADGSFFSEPESYHLVKHLDNMEGFNLANVPEGDYTGIEFLIGVDSTRNVSGAQAGALDVAQGMFWDWTTGYLFFKIEGICSTQADTSKHDYIIHVGGFTGANNCLQTCSFVLPKTISAKNNHTSTVVFYTSVDEVFANPSVLGLDTYRAVSGGRPAKVVSGNYKDMFEVYSVNNN